MHGIQDQQVQWNPQPPKKQHPVIKWVSIIGGAAILLVIALVAMAAAMTSSGSTQLSTSTAPSTSPAAAPAPAPVHTQTPQEWLAGSGGDALINVQQDLTKISQDATDYDTTALAADGQELATDSKTARTLPPPIPGATHHYKLAMRDFVRAGNLLVAGDIPGATEEISLGTVQIQQATADISSN